jgi:uncharacterized membrane protein
MSFPTSDGRISPDVNGRREALPGRWFGQLGPLFLLAAAGGYLAAHWAEVPARFPIHWDLAGQADGWATRSVPATFAPLLIGAVLCLMLQLLGYGLLRTSWGRFAAGGEAARDEGESRQIVAQVLLVAAYLLALTSAPLGILPVIFDPLARRLVLAGVVVSALLAPLVMVTWVVVRRGPLVRTRRRWRAAWAGAGPGGEGRRASPWRWGLFYVDRDDPALFVPKRLGLGYTFNLGRPSGWAILGALVAVLLMIALIALVAW